MATSELERLASAIERQTPADGGSETAVPALRLSRYSAPSELVALVYEPSLCVVAQGAKDVLLADEAYRLDPAQFLLVSVDLPVTARVVEASPGRPYLGVRIAIDPAVVGELLADGMTALPLGPSCARACRDSGRAAPARRRHSPRGPPRLSTGRPATGASGSSGDHLPLTRKSARARLRQIASAGAPAQRIAKAIRWLRGPFRRPSAHRVTGEACKDEPVGVSPPFQGRDGHEPPSVPEAPAAPGGPPADAGRGARRGRGRVPRRLREPVPVQPGVPANIRRHAAQDVAVLKIEAQPTSGSGLQRFGALTDA